MSMKAGVISTLVGALALTGCAQYPGATEQPWERANLVQGPPIEDIVTAFDSSLGCLRGKIKRNVVFAVGQVTDNTGKETYADGGSGKLVTQGAGDMVQSALFRAGVTVVNRSTANVSVIEATWGIRDIKSQVPVNFYISGSINSLDYIPGGGYAVSVAGFGPKKRQSRIMVGLDLSMIDAFTGRVVASIPLQKQIFMSESGFGGTNFFGDTLVSLDAGGMEREAMNFALRQMVSLATFELLGQVMNQQVYSQCRELVPGGAGAVSNNGTADPFTLASAEAGDLNIPVRSAQEVMPVPQPGNPGAVPGVPQPGAQQPGAQQPGVVPGGPDDGRPQKPAHTQRDNASIVGKEAALTAARSISMANKAKLAETIDERTKLAAEAIRLANLALKLLQEAARLGLDGEEGDVTAVVVQEAMKAAATAGREAAAAARAEVAPPASPVPETAPQKSSAVEPPKPGPRVAVTETPAPSVLRLMPQGGVPSGAQVLPLGGISGGTAGGTQANMFVAPTTGLR